MHLPIGALRPGIAPPDVLDEAASALGSLHTIEKKDIEVKSGVPRIVLRFDVPAASRMDEDRRARQAVGVVIDHLTDSVCAVEPARAVLLTRRAGGRFLPV